MHKLCWKENYFKSADVSMLGHGCVVSQYPQFYDITKNIYQVLPLPNVGSYSGETVEIFFMVSISDMPSVKYWQNLGKIWILQNRRFLKSAGLVIRVLRHWQLLE